MPIKAFKNHSFKRDKQQESAVDYVQLITIDISPASGYPYLCQLDCLRHLKWLDFPVLVKSYMNSNQKEINNGIWRFDQEFSFSINHKFHLLPVSSPCLRNHTHTHTHLKATRSRPVPKGRKPNMTLSKCTNLPCLLSEHSSRSFFKMMLDLKYSPCIYRINAIPYILTRSSYY